MLRISGMTVPLFGYSNIPPYCTKNGANTRLRIADSLIRTFNDGPDVSFNRNTAFVIRSTSAFHDAGDGSELMTHLFAHGKSGFTNRLQSHGCEHIGGRRLCYQCIYDFPIRISKCYFFYATSVCLSCSPPTTVVAVTPPCKAVPPNHEFETTNKNLRSLV